MTDSVRLLEEVALHILDGTTTTRDACDLYLLRFAILSEADQKEERRQFLVDYGLKRV